MEPHALPPLYCPFPAQPFRSQWEEQLAQQTLSWAQQFHLISHEPTAVVRFRAEQQWQLISRVYPTPDFPRLAIVADWNTWGFCLDDVGDASGITGGLRPCGSSLMSSWRC